MEIIKIKRWQQMVNLVMDYGVITHNSMYHADDVSAACILKIIGVIASYDQIQRLNKIPEGFKGLVFDIGEGEFDHHQVDCKLHEDGSRYSACTLIAEYFLEEDKYEVLYNNFLKGIELTDNNGQKEYPNRYCHAVSSAFQLKKSFKEVCEALEPVINSILNGDGKLEWNSKLQEIEDEFKKYEIIENAKVGNFIIVNEGKKVAVLNEHLPAYKFGKSSLILLIEKSLRGGYSLTVVSNKLKIPQDVISWDGCSFVHTAGFIAVFDTIENAEKAAEKLLK